MKIDIVTDSGGDWTSLYKDGKLVEGNHSISVARGLEALGIEFDAHETSAEDFEGHEQSLFDVPGISL